MKAPIKLFLLVAGVVLANAASATGMATCESDSKEDWQPQATLQEQLEAEGWTVRRIKEDGGCYEVYALDAEGERVEAYFQPVTLEPVPTEED